MKHKSTKYYKARADRLFSLWVRQRDAMEGVATCVTCNSFDQGRQFEYGLYLDKRYGEGTAEKLSILSKVSCKRGWFDFKIIGDELLEKLKANNFITR